jgi:thiol:disulfide interchange protein DsbD
MNPIAPSTSATRSANGLALLLLLALVAWLGLAPAARADDFLPPEQAFRISVKAAGPRSVEVDFRITAGYYMYRDRFKFRADGATLGAPQLPAGQRHYDDALQQTVETYRDEVRIVVPVTQAQPVFRLGVIGQGCAEQGLCYPPMPSAAEVRLAGFGGDGSVKLLATGDAAASLVPAGGAAPATATAAPAADADAAASAVSGTAAGSIVQAFRPRNALEHSSAAGIDRPPVAGGAAAQTAATASVPQESSAQPSALAASAPGVAVAESTGAAVPAEDAAVAAPATAPDDDAGALANALRGHHFWSVIAVFFGAGLLLSLTPCVLPMLPILSSIIVGNLAGAPSAAPRRRGLLLAASYSLGMALVYTALGIAAGLAGRGLAAALQTPAALGTFGVLLVLLSLSMFGAYELQLPSALTTRLTQASHRLQGGQAAGVFAMGGLSALIVSPCVAAPLAGALLYLSQTRDVLLGGSALFALACGMSVPLLLVGASAGALLPRAGRWMEGVKQFFGVLLLAVAIWMVQPVLPPSLALAAWGALLVLAAALLWPQPMAGTAPAGLAATWRRAGAGFALLLALAEIGGAAAGGADALQPLAPFAGARAAGPVAAADALPFRTVRSVQELDDALRSAGRPVMLDFYADWCVSCKEMDRFTFSDPAIRQRLANALLLRADVTADTAADRALLKRFSLFGPPGTIFFDAQGNELRTVRVVGFQDVARFGRTLSAAGL